MKIIIDIDKRMVIVEEDENTWDREWVYPNTPDTTSPVPWTYPLITWNQCS